MLLWFVWAQVFPVPILLFLLRSAGKVSLTLTSVNFTSCQYNVSGTERRESSRTLSCVAVFITVYVLVLVCSCVCVPSPWSHLSHF